MKEFTAINSDRGMAELQKYLCAAGTEVLAIDFEAESNLHVYGEMLCLIQVFDGARYFAIDPFRISRDALAGFLENKRIVKLFYGSESDLSLVYKQYEIKIKSVLDLKVLVDILELERKGLDCVLSTVLGKTITGKGKYQMHNWTLRPIREEAIEYALTDVEHLFELRDELVKRIMGAGKYLELVYGLVRSRNEFDSKSIPTIFKSGEYRNLKSGEKERLKQIYVLRDGIAKGQNLPPNLVLEKKYLFQLAAGEIAIESISFSKKLSEKSIGEMLASLSELLGRGKEQ